MEVFDMQKGAQTFLDAKMVPMKVTVKRNFTSFIFPRAFAIAVKSEVDGPVGIGIVDADKRKNGMLAWFNRDGVEEVICTPANKYGE